MDAFCAENIGFEQAYNVYCKEFVVCSNSFIGGDAV